MPFTRLCSARVHYRGPCLGDAQHQVHMEGYQVSNQCQALVRDECLVPTKDAPELAYVRQSTAEKYIPDVYYKVSHPSNPLISCFEIVVVSTTSVQRLRA